MSDKIKIDSEQVISNSKGVITYADEDRNIKKAAAKDVEIITRDISDTPAEEDYPVDIPSPEPQAATSVMNPLNRAPSPKRSRKPKTVEVQAPAQPNPGDDKVATKKTAPKKAAKKKTESTGSRTIGGKAVDLSRYSKSKTAAGGTSYNNGDTVASKLEGKSLEDVYSMAARTLKVEEKDLRKQYGHLNAGMQRMTLGNRMRKVLMPKSA